MAETPSCEKCSQLEQALESRTIIGTAIGLLMEREVLDQEAAFAMLRTASQNTNRKLRDIASDLVAEAEGAATAAKPRLNGAASSPNGHSARVPSRASS